MHLLDCDCDDCVLDRAMRAAHRKSVRIAAVAFTVDGLWDALRKQCCSSKPYTDAKAIVMVRRADIDALFAKPERGG